MPVSHGVPPGTRPDSAGGALLQLDCKGISLKN
jgi:hypothetical protein